MAGWHKKAKFLEGIHLFPLWTYAYSMGTKRVKIVGNQLMLKTIYATDRQNGGWRKKNRINKKCMDYPQFSVFP